MKALVAGLTVAVFCLAGAVSYLAWDKLQQDDASPQSVIEEPTATMDVPHYTQEEVTAKVMNYEFDIQRDGETERLIVENSLAYTLCGGMIGETPITILSMDAATYLETIQQGARPCEHDISSVYDGAGRWTVTIRFVGAKPVIARFSFREDSGEIIPLDVQARHLIGR
jgi:hypothetical protein